MSGIITALLLLGGIIAMYFITYILNKNTDAPEGAQVIDKCSTCGSGSCSLSRKEEFRNSSQDECEIYERT
jgi:hypothetical protein